MENHKYYFSVYSKIPEAVDGAIVVSIPIVVLLVTAVLVLTLVLVVAIVAVVFSPTSNKDNTASNKLIFIRSFNSNSSGSSMSRSNSNRTSSGSNRSNTSTNSIFGHYHESEW